MSNPAPTTKFSPIFVTSPEFPKSPSVERLEHGMALSFAQERARLHGLHLDECVRTIPTLKEIHQKFQDNVVRFGKVVSDAPLSPDVDGEICNSPVLPSFHGVPRQHQNSQIVSMPSPMTAQDKKKYLLLVHSQLAHLSEQLGKSVLYLEEIRDKDRARRLSSDYISRAVSSALSDQSSPGSTPNPNTTLTPYLSSATTVAAMKAAATPPTVGSTNSWSDNDFPPPFSLVPPTPPTEHANPSAMSLTAFTQSQQPQPQPQPQSQQQQPQQQSHQPQQSHQQHPAPAPVSFSVPSSVLPATHPSQASTSTAITTTQQQSPATMNELNEIVKAIQQMLEKVRDGQVERHFDRSHIHAEERAAIEKQYKDRIRRYKSRLAQYEHLLVSHGIQKPNIHHHHHSQQQQQQHQQQNRSSSRTLPSSSSPSPPSPRTTPRSLFPAAFLRVVDVALEFLCVGDYFMSVIRAMISMVAWPKNVLVSWFAGGDSGTAGGTDCASTSRRSGGSGIMMDDNVVGGGVVVRVWR
eukprot:c12646_g1_i1.p1 GENE.c12646_g1_i1~~c12646_g1_i1.p1  ORF type:complete len:521 (-),score=133.91 c12646_g1_i1:421-1983(-)